MQKYLVTVHVPMRFVSFGDTEEQATERARKAAIEAVDDDVGAMPVVVFSEKVDENG